MRNIFDQRKEMSFSKEEALKRQKEVQQMRKVFFSS